MMDSAPTEAATEAAVSSSPGPSPYETTFLYSLGPFEAPRTSAPIANDWTSVMPKDHPPVLCLVTTADDEYAAAKTWLEPAIGYDRVLRVSAPRTAMLVGKFGPYQTALIQTRMDNDATKESLLQALRHLPSIRLVLAIGFGYGLAPAFASAPSDRQMIGDVMVSAKCVDLSTYRADGNAIKPRGNQVTSPLANILNQALLDGWASSFENWDERPRAPTVHFGTFLSLPVLFDSAEHAHRFVDAVADLKPIGGDMELFQIVSAVEKPGHAVKAWLAIKSICDFGGLIKKDKQGQQLAAATAVHFALYFLSIPSLLDGLLRSSPPMPDDPLRNASPRTKVEMLEEIKSLQQENEVLLRGRLYRVANDPYSKVCAKISKFEETPQANSQHEVNELAKLKVELETLVEELSRTRKEKIAVALVSAAEEKVAMNDILAMMEVLKKHEAKVERYFHPDQRLFSLLRGWEPRICLLVGSYNNGGEECPREVETDRRLWILDTTEERPTHPRRLRELKPGDLSVFVRAVKPECVLLVADVSCNLLDELDAEERSQLLQITSFIVFEKKYGNVSHGRFIDKFLESCLAGFKEEDFDSVETAYIRAMPEGMFDDMPVRFKSCRNNEKRIKERLWTTTPNWINMKWRNFNLLETIKGKVKNVYQEAFVRILEFMLSVVDKEQIKISVKIRCTGSSNSSDMERQLKNFGAEVDFREAGSIVYHCIVPDLPGFRQWGLEATSDAKLRIEDITVTGLVIETAALRRLQQDPSSASAIANLTNSELPEERFFARLLQSEGFSRLEISSLARSDIEAVIQQDGDAVKIEDPDSNVHMTDVEVLGKSPEAATQYSVTAEDHLLFLGNPGVGKSTILNCHARRQIFKSGLTSGTGLTDKLDQELCNGIWYMDTPGLADEALRGTAATSITQALKQGGRYRIIFVVEAVNARVSPADKTSIQIILQSCPEIGNNYGILVNRCRTQFLNGLQNETNFQKFVVALTQNIEPPVKPGNIEFNPFVKDLNDEDNIIRDLPDRIIDWIDNLNHVQLTPDQADNIEWEKFDVLCKDMEGIQRQLEENERVYEELLRKRDREIEEMRAILAKRYRCPIM